MPARRRNADDEVPLQVTVPQRIKQELDVKAAQTGRTKRTIVLEALRAAGFDMTDEEVTGRRGRGRA